MQKIKKVSIVTVVLAILFSLCVYAEETEVDSVIEDVLGVVEYKEKIEEVDAEEVVNIIEDTEEETEAVYVSNVTGLNVRQKPNQDSNIVTLLPYCSEVDVITSVKNDKWLKIDQGYIMEKYTSETSPLEDEECLGDWRITAYAETGYACANGNYPSVGYTIACNSLDFGTKVYIEGVGIRTVEDRGPTYLGSSWCDLYLGDYNSCVNWGDQTRRVWKLT